MTTDAIININADSNVPASIPAKISGDFRFFSYCPQFTSVKKNIELTRSLLTVLRGKPW